MNNDFSLLFLKHTGTLIQKTKTKSQETFEYKMIKQRQTFSFIPPKQLVEEDKWLLVVTSLEATNSVFKITDKQQFVFNHYTTSLADQICWKNY